ncbi:cadmium-translocating P-type ATPase [Paraeggerthella hongkongensis]|uniref:heavy metal translocating P-type ATPase n=1 Tax=Paraeggerthella hominis TaxID=2897351 RepID=UPI001C11F97D|nr:MULTISPECIES: heavy metal translocating P-type ATPase [Paraeggerthella]MBU5404368.1 cadmium-translocating P-type ATPase [Paraeggerthella hongkongensis]MCD2432064.1 cadmium-translocating P-type ATPase [Paraeggerthella hominis]
MNKKQRRTRNRIVAAIVLFVLVYAAIETLPLATWLGSETNALWIEFILFLVPYLIAGYDVLLRAAKNIGRGQVFDENFLMTVATIGAFALVLFPDSDPHMAEGAAVMLFYQVGELFQSYAVGKSRKSIADMMDIAPDYANIERDGSLAQVDPYEVNVGDEIVIKPGERVPLDGVVVDGRSQLDTAALTGESVPREVQSGDEIISGCVNLSGKLVVRVSKPFGESTVSRILELVENAAEKKARTENFITRFARYYTPAVVIIAALLAVAPPLLTGASWSDWVQRGLVFLVVSCPCALVISVPLSFFGGIGGASRLGILVKGSNYLEALASAETVVFDKTGTLTDGSFNVVAVHPQADIDPDRLLSIAAHAEAYSDHPIALSVKKAYSGTLDRQRIADTEEQSGHGVRATIDEHVVYVGNDKLMSSCGVDFRECDLTGTILHVSLDGSYIGHIVIADVVKPDAAQAVADLRAAGVRETVMLTGDRADVAAAVASKLGIDEYRAQLLPQDKVAEVEKLLDRTHAHGRGRGKLAFVGDGINDAPVLTRADIGIAMGAMGSDAAIEAADVVLMDDKPSSIAQAIRLARKTMRIVRQNIVFALGVKFLVLILAAIGFANMWLAVFADVGVAVLAILNAMRAMNVGSMKR